MIERIDQCTITLTRNCNLRCSFCYAKETGYRTDDWLDFEDLKRIVDFCDQGKVKYIVFTGGEPLLYPKLLDALQYIKAKEWHITVAVATNGLLLDSFEFCRQLINSGVEYIDVSLKGKDTEQWCKFTGYNGLDRQLRAVHNLSRLSTEFTCSMVVTPENVQTVCEAVQIAHDHGAKQFSFTFIIDNEDSSEKNDAYLEKNNPFVLVSEFVNQIDRLNKITEEWWIEYSFPMCVYTEEQLEMLRGRFAAPCQIHTANGVTFDTELNLLPCNMYLDYRLGQLGKEFQTYDEFMNWVEGSKYGKIMDSLRGLPADECKACSYLSECRGGCPVLWKNYSLQALKATKNRNNPV